MRSNSLRRNPRRTSALSDWPATRALTSCCFTPDQGFFRRSAQSGSPAALLPGVERLWIPEFENGDPGMSMEFPLLGSTHFADTGPLNLLRSTVSVVPIGAYDNDRVPSAK